MRVTDMFRILTQIGLNTEQALKETVDAEIRSSTEFLYFPEARLRSWLAALLRRVPYKIAASGYHKLKVNFASPTSPSVSVPVGAMIKGSNGKLYRLESAITYNAGESPKDFFVKQGDLVTFSGIYTDFISISVNDVDMSTADRGFSDDVVQQKDIQGNVVPWDVRGDSLQVFLGGVPIPPCPEVLYDALSIPANSDEDIETKLARLNNLTRGSVFPSAGYFAFYFSNTLFVKIFPGTRTNFVWIDSQTGQGNVTSPNKTLVIPPPTSLQYSINVRVCDGVRGCLYGNETLDSFISPLLDSSQKKVDYEIITGPPMVDGQENPSQYKLVQLLREKFFVRAGVASAPEYEIWYKAQPEVGDAVVMGDFENWRADRSYRDSVIVSSSSIFIPNAEGTDWYATPVDWETDFRSTGRIDVYLLDHAGRPLSGSQPSSLVTLSNLERRLNRVADIGLRRYMDPVAIEHYIEVGFLSALDEDEFVLDVKKVIGDFYSPTWVWSVGGSLFANTDFTQVRARLSSRFSPVGIDIRAFHFYRYIFSTILGTITFSYLDGEEPGGYYRYFRNLGSDDNPDWVQYPQGCVDAGIADNESSIGYVPLNLRRYTGYFVEREVTEIGHPSLQQGDIGIFAETVVDGVTLWEDIGIRHEVLNDLGRVVKEIQLTSPLFTVGLQASIGATGGDEGKAQLRCWWPCKDRGIAVVGAKNAYRVLSAEGDGGGIRVYKYS